MSLFQIQSELKAPKGQRNTFGKYNYRSCEDIVEAVKPILAKYETSLVITDEIVLVGDRFYVKATAKLVGDGINESVSAFAREPLNKKGMDEAQITGATSSYARKYALNGLFAIDDTKDADSMDNRENAPQNNYPTPSKQTPADKKRMYAEFVNYVTEYGIDYKEFEAWMKDFGVKLGEEIHKWLRNKENLNTQLDSYKTFLSERSA